MLFVIGMKHAYEIVEIETHLVRQPYLSMSGPMSRPQTRRSHRKRQISQIVPAGSSWLSLVAATTGDIGPMETLRVRVHGRVAENLEPYRLVVQAYRSEVGPAPRIPSRAARAHGSTQREVTAEQLARGIVVEVVLPRLAAESGRSEHVLAWIEPGRPDLDFDALLARPSKQAQVGVVRARLSQSGSGLEVELTAA